MIESKSNLLEKYTQELTKLESAYFHLHKHFIDLKENLETSLQTLNSIINHISEGLIFIKIDGSIALFNPAATLLTGISASLALQSSYSTLFSDYFFGFSMVEALATPNLHRRIFLTLKEECDVEVSTSCIPKKGLVLILTNRTEQQKLQKSLNQVERLQELGEMAATLAHEIRNPLGGIEGFAQLLKRDLTDLHHQAMVSAILEGTGALNNLVTSVLDYARPLSLHFSPANLVDVLRETIAQFAIIAPTLSCSLLTSVATYRVSIDKARFKLVILNLFRNSQEAQATQIVIEIREEGAIYFIDNGLGISSSNLEKIFTPFFTTKIRGNGLGLAESLAVIKAHGGSIEVVSEEGKGTQFKIKLVN